MLVSWGCRSLLSRLAGRRRLHHLRPPPDVLKAFVNDEPPIFEDLSEMVVARGALVLRDCDPLAIWLLQCQPPLLGLFAGVRDRVFDHVNILAIHHRMGALESTLQGVTVQLLQESP